MLKIWSEFIFGHLYLCYSLKLLPTTQCTFIPLHFTPFWGKLDIVENLVRIHLQPLLPPLFFETFTNHSAYFHSASFCFLWGKSDNVENLIRIHLRPLVPPLYFETITNHSVYFHSTVFCFLLRQIGQCWKFGQNSSSETCTSFIFWNYYQPLSILSFHCISLHFEANWTMLKIWSEFMFSHLYLHFILKLLPTTQCTFILLHFASFWGKSDNVKNLVGIHLWPFVPPLHFETITNHSAYFHSTAFRFFLRQIRQCWKFGRISSLTTPTSIIFWNYYQPLSIPSFCCILLPFDANQTMLKIWSEFIFSHLYLHYCLKLLLTTQHTFILLHFAPFWGKLDNVENLVGFHFQLLLPPLFFETITNHSAYLHSTAFCFLLRQIR